MNLVKYLYRFLGIYLAFLVQSLFFENLKIFSCSPDIVLTVLIILAVSTDFTEAALLGAFAGLLTDVMYGTVFGINILIYMYTAILVSIAADKKNANSPLIMSWICFISIAAYEIVLAVLKTVVGTSARIGALCANIFVKGIFVAIFALCFVLVVQYIKKRRQKNICKGTSPEKEAAE